MIQYHEGLQALECTVCGEMAEVMRRVLRDPDAFLETKDAFRTDHRDCREGVDRATAVRDREFAKRVRAELRKAGI